MQQHVKLVAILNIVYGALIALAGVIVLAVLGSVAGLVASSGDADAEMGSRIVALVGSFVPILLALIGAPSIIAGIWLLKYQNWARILAIVVSVFHLPSIPFGTALGIYGLWTLLKPETEALFRQPQPAWPVPPMQPAPPPPPPANPV